MYTVYQLKRLLIFSYRKLLKSKIIFDSVAILTVNFTSTSRRSRLGEFADDGVNKYQNKPESSSQDCVALQIALR